MAGNREPGGGGNNPDASDAWDSLGAGTRGTFVMGPDGKMIPKEEYDAAMEAHEREEYYKTHPGAREADALDARLGQMDADPGRFDRFEGEHERGASTRDAEYTTLNTGENGMYAAAPDGTPLNNAKRKEMARMMHDAEDLLTFEEDPRYKDYIARERAKIGTVYKSRDDFHHRVVARIRGLEQARTAQPGAGGNPGGEGNPGGDGESEGNPGAGGNPGGEGNPGGNGGEGDPGAGGNPGGEGNPGGNGGEGDPGGKPEGEQPESGEEEEKPKAEVGEIKIKGVEQKFEEIEHEKIEQAGKRLDETRPLIAELYARNRRLIVGGKNRAEFQKAQRQYAEAMAEYVKLKSKETYESEKKDLSKRLEQKLDELKAEIEEKLAKFADEKVEGKYRTQEEVDAEKERLIKEAEEKAKAWYDEENGKIKTKVNAEFLKELTEQATELEKATVDKLDNGSVCRKFISKVLNNKILKGALVAAGAAGLVATGAILIPGLAVGTMSLGFGLTAGGAALGAVRGGASSFLMSRQDSKVSKVRGFASGEDIKRQIGEMDITGENPDTQNVANWLMGQYGNANAQDRSSNVKRTAVATGLGVALGALASGIHINDVVQTSNTTQGIIGNSPIQYKPQYDASNVDVANNHGFLQIFEQVGGNPSNQTQWDKAFSITEQIAQKYGVVSDYGKGLISPKGIPELLPGKPSTWDATSQQFLNDILDEWAAQGVIPRIISGGGPIWGPVTTITKTLVENSIGHFLTQATATVGAAIIGSRIGGAGSKNIENTQPAPIPPEPSEGTPTSSPDSPEPPEPPATPVDSDYPGASSPEAPESQGAPEAQETPENQPAPENPEAPEAPESQGAPEAQEAPQSPETPAGTTESPEESPNRPISPDERRVIEGVASSYNEAIEKGELSEQALKWKTISSLAIMLGYFTNQGSFNDNMAAYSNLSENQRIRLNMLFNQVVETASNQRNSAPTPQQQPAN